MNFKHEPEWKRKWIKYQLNNWWKFVRLRFLFFPWMRRHFKHQSKQNNIKASMYPVCLHNIAIYSSKMHESAGIFVNHQMISVLFAIDRYFASSSFYYCPNTKSIWPTNGTRKLYLFRLELLLLFDFMCHEYCKDCTMYPMNRELERKGIRSRIQCELNDKRADDMIKVIRFLLYYICCHRLVFSEFN